MTPALEAEDARGARILAKARMNWKALDDPGWLRLREAIEQVEPGQTMIISNESLYARGLAFERLGTLLDGFEVKVVLYVREQAEFIQSMILQNQKKGERAFDFRDPDRFEPFLRRRNLNYYQMCARLEQVFGDGTIDARIFDRGSLVGNDVVVDFFTAIGVDGIESMMKPPQSNSSLTAEVAEALRALNAAPLQEQRYSDLLDAGLRLSHNGVGSKYFLTEVQVGLLRARFAESNRQFVSRYLANADEIPEAVAWCDPGSSPDLGEVREAIVQLASAAPRLNGRWGGGPNVGRRIFGWGWNLEESDKRVLASFCEDEAIARFRLPFTRRFQRRDEVRVTLIPVSVDQDPGPCAVSVNGRDLGEVMLLSEPIVFPCALIESDDLVEITFRPHNGGRALSTQFKALEISHH
ncbi:MAG: hypothetical protein GY713_20115 [Actinomycetia bacterium]|nr:hypothetical protein [Actinomycetes bacterium]